ncbi:MAG: hypothetical protein HQM01_08505 [Magnetococcales bacterium]|nr:hypothetical protein [Magnetococcales bacterium]
MEASPRILVVLDPTANPEPLIRTALKIGSRHARAELILVSLLDPLRASRQTHATLNGLQTELDDHARTALISKLDALGCDWPNTDVVTAYPPQEVTPLAWAWEATLILADPASAREVRQGWFPWLHAPTPLPCPLLIVESAITPPVLPWRGWFQRLRLGWPSRNVAPISHPHTSR